MLLTCTVTRAYDMMQKHSLLTRNVRQYKQLGRSELVSLALLTGIIPPNNEVFETAVAVKCCSIRLREIKVS